MPRPFETLRETLLQSGVSPRHVRRYLVELSEHLADLTAEQCAAGFDNEDAAIRARARLGRDEELLDAMLAHKEFRSWAARMPLVFFGLLPPVVTLLAAFVVMAPLVLCAKAASLVGRDGINAPHWFRLLAATLVALGNFTLAPLLAFGFVWLATRQRLRHIWPGLAILLIALLDLQFQAHFAAPGQHGGAIGVDAGLWLFHLRGLMENWPLICAQLLLILAPALWLVQKKFAIR
jgi:hypothetical protein